MHLNILFNKTLLIFIVNINHILIYRLSGLISRADCLIAQLRHWIHHTFPSDIFPDFRREEIQTWLTSSNAEISSNSRLSYRQGTSLGCRVLVHIIAEISLIYQK